MSLIFSLYISIQFLSMSFLPKFCELNQLLTLKTSILYFTYIRLHAFLGNVQSMNFTKNNAIFQVSTTVDWVVGMNFLRHKTQNHGIFYQILVWFEQFCHVSLLKYLSSTKRNNKWDFDAHLSSFCRQIFDPPPWSMTIVSKAAIDKMLSFFFLFQIYGSK